jgi:deoxycytidine triphosphate deaminase
MTVIPLKTEGPNRTVVQSQEDFNVEGNAVLIAGLDLAQLNEQGASNTSYDLRVGKQYRDHTEPHPKDIPDTGSITLYPGSAFIIQTEELVHLPRRMYGIIAPKVGLLQDGLSTTFSKIDPGYPGPLLVTLFNLGQTTRTLKRKERFCAFTLFEVAPGARLYEKGAKQITAQLAKQPRRSFREFLEVHHVAVMIALIIVTLLLALEHLLTFIWDHTHP